MKIYLQELLGKRHYITQTQTPFITSTSSTVQTDMQKCHNNSTQTKTFQTTQATQTSILQSSTAVQTDHITIYTSTIDSTDSSISTEVSNELVESTRPNNSNRKRKIHNKDQGSTKQRKRVSFLQDQQNSPELLTVNRPITEIYPNT